MKIKKFAGYCFSISLVALLSVCGFFLLYKNNDEQYVTENLEVFNEIQRILPKGDVALAPFENSGNLTTGEQYNYYRPYDYTNGLMIMDVVLYEFDGQNVFNDRFLETLNYEFGYIATAFDKWSLGKFNIKFNIYIHHSTNKLETYLERDYSWNIDFEVSEYQYAFRECEAISAPNGKGNAKLLIYGYDGEVKNPNSMFWPHAWYSGSEISKLVVMTPDSINFLYHEIHHLFNLEDLYSNENDYLSAGFDPLYISRYFYESTNAYNKYLLGWLNKSYTTDDVATSLEVILNEGTFIVNTPEKRDSTIAYQFGNTNEFFMVEIRERRLSVIKVNTRYKNNLSATSKLNAHVWKVEDNNSGWGFTGCPGETLIDLPYGMENSGYSIINIFEFQDGRMQFDVVKQTNNELDGNIIVKNKCGEVLNTAKITLNSEVVSSNGQFSSKFKEKDIIVASCEGYTTKEIALNGGNFNFNDRNIEIVLDNPYANDEAYCNELGDVKSFDIMTMFNDAITSIQSGFEVFVNGILSPFQNMFTLNDGDNISIKSNGYQDFNATYSNNSVCALGGGKVYYESDYRIGVLLAPKTQTYYFSVIDENKTALNNISIMLFNSNSNSWEKAMVAKLNNLGQTVYGVANCSGVYTKAKIIYTSYGTSVEKIIPISTTQTKYNVTLSKNIIQSAGDTFDGIKKGFLDAISGGLSFFKGLWK